MKYLICQDLHISGRNPVNRIDNYLESTLKKLDEILKIAKKQEVHSILCGGDLFESNIVTTTIIDEVMDKIEENGIEWQIIPGNHDMIGHNWNNSKGTSLAHIFRRSDLIKKLETFIPPDDSALIQGFQYYHAIEIDIKNKGIKANKKLLKTMEVVNGNPLKIALIHALITEKPLPTELHICYKDIKTNFDIIFVAHNHLQWGIKEYNGTKFVNIGCIGRRKIDEVDINPTVAILDTKTRDLELIELKSAKPGKEIFNLEKVEKENQYKDDIDKFITSLTTEKVRDLDLLEIIEYLAKENNIDDKIKKEIVNRIGE